MIDYDDIQSVTETGDYPGNPPKFPATDFNLFVVQEQQDFGMISIIQFICKIKYENYLYLLLCVDLTAELVGEAFGHIGRYSRPKRSLLLFLPPSERGFRYQAETEIRKRMEMVADILKWVVKMRVGDSYVKVVVLSNVVGTEKDSVKYVLAPYRYVKSGGAGIFLLTLAEGARRCLGHYV